MRAIGAILAMIGICAGQVHAGEIFGALKIDGKSAGKGLKIGIKSAARPYSAQTDNYGSYRCFVQEKGKCTFTVHVEKDSASTEIFSYAGSTRYDFGLERKDGRYTLKRK